MMSRALDAAVESAEGRLTVVSSDRSCTVLVLRLSVGETLRSRRHLRSDAVLQVLSGIAQFEGLRKDPLSAPGVLFVPSGETYSTRNAGSDTLLLLVVLCPGVTTLDSRPYGSVHCPLCNAEVAIEEGDVSGDRFICPDCTAWMRIVETEKGYIAEPVEPD